MKDINFQNFLSVDDIEQKKYIEDLILKNNKSFRKTTTSIIQYLDYFKDNNYVLFHTYLKILATLYDEKSIIFYKKNGKDIFINKEDVILFNIFLAITHIIEKNPQQYQDFFYTYLCDIHDLGINSFNLLEGSEERGFLFDCLLYIPQ